MIPMAGVTIDVDLRGGVGRDEVVFEPLPTIQVANSHFRAYDEHE
jgi:hypothetical protein